MKKAIFLIACVVTFVSGAFLAFKPAAAPMAFITLGTNIYQLPTQNADSSWTWNFIAWYGVKDNPYTVKVGTDYRWAQWANLTMKTYNTDATVALKVAQDTADAYRKRVYPDIK